MRWPCEAAPPDVLAGVVDQDTAQVLTPDRYWARLRPLLADFGISRVADITGLDHIGWPVAQAVRPDARSNAVTQGKAATLEGAAVGAVLECLEMAAGEALEHWPTVAANDLADWASFAPGLPSGTFWPDTNTSFVACRDILAEVNGTLPKDLISTDFRRDAPAAAAPILRHSIGLGAGTTPAAAVMHGVLECIEADARLRDESLGGATRIAIHRGDPTYGDLLAQVEDAGLRIAIHALPNAAGVAVAMASIMEAPGVTTLPLPAVGYSARFTYAEATKAALSEAVQARLAVISGAREDLTQRFYHNGACQEDLAAEWARHGPDPFAMELHESTPTNLRGIVEAVAPVYAVPLCWAPDVPLYIVRIVAPRLTADPMRLVPT